MTEEKEEVLKFLEKEQEKFLDKTYYVLVDKLGSEKATTYLLAHYLDLVAQISLNSNTTFEKLKKTIFKNLDHMMDTYMKQKKETDE